MALNDILELSKDENFNLQEHLEKQLKLRKDFEKGVDRIYDKKEAGDEKKDVIVHMMAIRDLPVKIYLNMKWWY